MINIQIHDNIIHLRNDLISYVMEIQEGMLLHQYFGPAIPNWMPVPDQPSYKRSFATEHPGFARPFDELPFEYPQAGRGDFREDAMALQTMQFSKDCYDFRFQDCEIVETLIQPDGMPGLHGPGRTLKITLRDTASQLDLELYYGMLDHFAGVSRFQKLINCSENTILIRKLASTCLELPPEDWYLLSLAGTHLKEGTVQVSRLLNGKICLDSRRGPSSAQHPPFLALCEGKPAWDQGEVYGLALIYSGNHAEIVEQDYYGQIRVCAGVHPETLHWQLESGQSFCTPQCVLSCTQNGLNGMADSFHTLFLHHLFAWKPSPILINSWESYYYDTTEENLLDLAQRAADAGMEMLVIDDGWFRKENNSRSPIGDWQINRHKLPEGFTRVYQKLQDNGLKMGLWFEPEAISANSELAHTHPEWILRYLDQTPVEGRHELLLDLSQKEVQDHLIQMLESYLDNGMISYIKWDMNRPQTDTLNSEKNHRYILGLYRILDHITSRYPDILIEGCSSGGSRLDPGILAYCAQNWPSDNTDPFDRIQIQSGQALFLPVQTLNAHVSASPNHQTGRTSTLQDRFEIARFFQPGYELNLSQLLPEESSQLRAQTAQLKADRKWMNQARFRQLDSGWMKVDADRRRAEVLIFQEHFDPSQARKRVRIPGLDADTVYTIAPLHCTMTGAQLAHSGLVLPLASHDFSVYPLSIHALSPEKTA